MDPNRSYETLPHSLPPSLSDPEAQIRALAEHIVNTSRAAASSVGGSSVASLEQLQLQQGAVPTVMPRVPMGARRELGNAGRGPQAYHQQQQPVVVNGRQVSLFYCFKGLSGEICKSKNKVLKS